MSLRLCALQIPHVEIANIQEKAAQLDFIEREIRSRPNNDVFVLPELSVTGYSTTCFENASVLAEDALSGQSFCFFSRLSRELGCYICYGIIRRVSQDVLNILADTKKAHKEIIHEDEPVLPPFTICAIVVGPTGEVEAVYDKLHVCEFGDSRERAVFQPGMCGLGIFTIRGFRIGLAICYDIRFPELFRALCIDHSCDVILHPVAWSKDNSFTAWHSFVKCRAIENQVYFVSVNWAGDHFGQSICCPPHIDKFSTKQDEQPLFLSNEEGAIEIPIEREVIERARSTFQFRLDRLAVPYSRLPLNSVNSPFLDNHLERIKKS